MFVDNFFYFLTYLNEILYSMKTLGTKNNYMQSAFQPPKNIIGKVGILVFISIFFQ